MTRTGKGWCPFADQIEGVTTFLPGGHERVGFCDHTAGGYYGTLTSSSFWNGAGVSVHFAIARDGRIAQIINIFDTAYAQGKLGPVVTWPPYQQMNQQNPNLYLISTEHEDWENSHPVAGSEWTPEQYASDLRVKQWCIEEIKLHAGNNLMKFGIDSLAGHHMFDSVNRAECPGKFWRDEYRQRLFNDLTGVNMHWVEKEHQLVATTDDGLEVVAIGDSAGNFPGRIAKLFGDKWLWLRNDNGNAVWSEEEGD